MPRLIVAYVAAAVLFVALDSLYLFAFGAKLFKDVLGDVLAPTVTIAPAVVFYLLFPIGLLVFATGPSLEAGGWTTALWRGGLFGFFAYATYDLTNFATIRNWSVTITLPDMVWGTILSGVTAAVACAIARAIFGPAS